MDPKPLCILSGLLTCASPAPAQRPHDQFVATYRSLAPTVPVRDWPEDRERPERTDPAHGEGSGESVMYLGLGGYTTNTAAHSLMSVNVDSSASGAVSIYGPQMWLSNTFLSVTSPRDLYSERIPLPVAKTIRVVPDTTKHLANPSTARMRRSDGRQKK